MVIRPSFGQIAVPEEGKSAGLYKYTTPQMPSNRRPDLAEAATGGSRGVSQGGVPVAHPSPRSADGVRRPRRAGR
jgi:hypothetical protein